MTLLQYNSPFATTVGPHITFQPLQCTFKRYDKLCEKIEWRKTTGSEGKTTIGQCDHYGVSILAGYGRVAFKPEVRFCIQRSFIKSNHMKLDNQHFFLNHKSNLQKNGCRLRLSLRNPWMNAGLGWPRQEQKMRVSGSASTSYQDNPTRWVIIYHFGLIVMRLYEPKPDTMQVWVKVWWIFHVGICFQEGDGDKATKIFQVVVEQPQNTTSEGCH